MPSIGKDLALIRDHLGFSAEDIHQATKIPLTTIQSIEDGSLFENKDEIKTYVRSFVRSYGRAIHLNEDDVVKALNQQEAGNYNHLLLKRFPELKDHIPPEPQPEKPEQVKSEEEKTDAPKKEEVKQHSAPEEKSKSPVAPPPGVRSVDWADMGKKFKATEKQVPVWLIGTILITSLVIGGAYLLYSNGVFSSESTTGEPPIAQETPPPVESDENGTDLSLDFTDEPAEEEEAPVTTLDEILYLTVYAAYDQLEPVRVWSDEKPRMDPYWMNQGQAFNFEFQDTIRVRGQYSRMLIFLNGHRVENFRQDHYNSEEQAVELTRDFFEEDTRWAAPIDLDLPENVAMPDSISQRPRF